MRTQLISAITTQLTTVTQFAVSQELPWSQNGVALFLKNLKRVYVDREVKSQSVLIPLLNAADILQDDFVTEVYLAVDAKNPPSQLELAISKILGSKDSIGITNFGIESDYTVDKQEDVMIFTFQFRLNQAIT